MEKDFQRDPNAIHFADAVAESILADPLDENGKVRLLTPNEEIWLATKIQNGQQARRDLEQYAATMDETLEAYLKEQVFESEAAHRTLVIHNMRLVGSIVRTIKGNLEQDYFQAGFLGLIQAAHGYDPHINNTRFSSYAYKAIRNEVLASIKGVQLPLNVNDTVLQIIHDVREYIEEYQQTHDGKMPGPQEIAKEFQINETTASRYLRNVNVVRPSVSLDVPVDDTRPGSNSRADYLAHKGPSVEDIVIANDRIEQIDTLLNSSGLSPKELLVVQLYHGFGGTEALNFHEIGDKFGFTKTRASQIYRSAKRKLTAGLSQLEVFGIEDI